MKALSRWASIGYALQRWEVLAAVVGTAVLVAAMLWFTRQLGLLADANPACPDPGAYVPGCEAFVTQFQDLGGWASQLLRASWAAPFGMGLVLGVPLVAREVEHGTAAVAWTLGRSRTRWLIRRLAFVLLVLVVCLGLIALTSEVLAAALGPTLHLDRDFTWFGRRGLLVVVRGVASLATGVALGALLGRTLPGVLVAAVASVLLFTAISFGMDRWNEAEAELVPAANGGIGSDTDGALLLGSRIELPSGELATWSDLIGMNDITEDMDGHVYGRVEDVGHPERAIGVERQLVIRGDQYGAVVVRESGVVAGIAVAWGMLATWIVRRRRPR